MSQRILLVDDDPQITRALATLLVRNGYIVAEENDSTKALGVARAFQPDVVILDFLMPKAHGGDVAWQLASEVAFTKPPMVILCSGVPSEEFKIKLPPTRIPILEKPVEAESLLELLREIEAA